MTPEEIAAAAAAEAAAAEAAAAEAAKKTVPLAALQEARAKIKALEDAAATRRAAEDTAAAEAAAKRGEFEKLYNETKAEAEAKAARLAALEAREAARVERLTAKNAERLEKLPEAWRGLVPAGLDPEAAAEQIERVEALVRADDTRPTGGRSSGGAGKPGASEEAKALAAQLGESVEIAEAIIARRKKKP